MTTQQGIDDAILLLTETAKKDLICDRFSPKVVFIASNPMGVITIPIPGSEKFFETENAKWKLKPSLNTIWPAAVATRLADKLLLVVVIADAFYYEVKIDKEDLPSELLAEHPHYTKEFPSPAKNPKSTEGLMISLNYPDKSGVIYHCYERKGGMISFTKVIDMPMEEVKGRITNLYPDSARR